MSKRGPLILVDDDVDDQELMIMCIKKLGIPHDLRPFQTADTALKYLYETSEKPFMIVSDINMPKMNGIEFKKRIDSCQILQTKCIPFVFLSTSIDMVKQSCNLNIQGYFKKGNSLEDLHETFKIILGYWDRTYHTS